MFFLNKFFLAGAGLALAGTGTGLGVYYGTKENKTIEEQKPNGPEPEKVREDSLRNGA